MAPKGGHGAGSGLVRSPGRGGNVPAARSKHQPLVRNCLIFKTTGLACDKREVTLRAEFLLVGLKKGTERQYLPAQAGALFCSESGAVPPGDRQRCFAVGCWLLVAPV